MKHLLSNALVFFTAVLMISQEAYAQTERGNFLLGSGLGFSYSRTNSTVEQNGIGDKIGKTTTSAVDFIPKIGFFFGDRFAAGAQFEITSLTAKTENEKNSANKFLAGPFVRYYLPRGESNKSFFFEANMGFGRTGVSEGVNSVSTTLLGFGIGPGFTIFSSDLIGIEALAKYNWVKGKTEINTLTSSELVSELDLSLGLQFYFARLVSAR